MRIRYENEQVRIEDVEEGDCFKYDNALWMKTDEIHYGEDNNKYVYRCVNLENGYIGRIADGTRVKVVDAEVVVK